MNAPKIVFDVDDTICDNNGRDYVNAIPFVEVIEKINYLHDELGYYISLHTARGMVSCEGNLERIKAKNEQILVEWLAKNNVKYDELIFGKPIADLYVDDKGMNLNEFMNQQFCKLTGGGSGSNLHRLGNLVKKDLGNNQDVINLKKWVDRNNGSCNYPKIISFLYESIYMEYIAGNVLSNAESNMDIADLTGLIITILRFKRNNAGHFKDFDLNSHINSLAKNRDEQTKFYVNECTNMLRKYEGVLKENASYSHGDFTLSNTIKTNDGSLYFIDARYNEKASSYLLDFAKLRMSLQGYERNFIPNSVINSGFVEMLDLVLESYNISDVVKVLQYMYTLRLYSYKNDEEKLKVKEMAIAIRSEILDA